MTAGELLLGSFTQEDDNKKRGKKSRRPGKDESKWLMEIVVCFLRHTSFLPVRWPHLCAPKNLSRVTFSMAGRLVNLLVVEVLGVCVLFWGLFVFLYFFLSFPLFLALTEILVVHVLPH